MFPETVYASSLQSMISPWYESLRDPSQSQEQVLQNLLKWYATTSYGKSNKASDVDNTKEFRTLFPVIDYKRLSPFLKRVQQGDYAAILPEPQVSWVMTRGSTGPAKVLPVTQTHLQQIFTCGSRALINYIVRKKDFGALSGKIFNLNFPSEVHKLIADGNSASYGYSSGTYARLNPAFDMLSLLPRQEEIDALGSGISKADWERRFELAYQKTLGENMVAAMGVTPVILSFARYVEKKHGKKPKDLWNVHALFCTSVRKIQFRYAPILRRYFGQIPVVEIYSATEGVFAQQLDDLPYVTPNYDTYFFEVETGHGMKMLHELNRGEWGRLVISSCMFPRYDIGDMVEAAGNNYFRIFGRSSLSTLLEHRLHRLFFRWLL